MKACGLVVEYNPFHNGHVHHINQAKKISGADCMIAVMSGTFLQRGEPAIIDKFHRTRAALHTGIDIMLELPYTFAVQSSNLFAEGAVLTLNEVGVESICFGSESGNIAPFVKGYDILVHQESNYKESLTKALAEGLSYPEASKRAYQAIGLTSNQMDLSKPNNILGFSYVRAIRDYHLPIDPLTIQRSSNNYHDEIVKSSIASATSIRKQLLQNHSVPEDIHYTMPSETIHQLTVYKQKATTWHVWEKYFHFLLYRVQTMDINELSTIAGMDEGIENRIKRTAKNAQSFDQWVNEIKTKRYTWTRIQRIFAHVLTNTKKTEINKLDQLHHVPYVRLLGVTSKGRSYLNMIKKQMDVPLITKLSKKNNEPMLTMEERATNAYYSILPLQKQKELFRQELAGPIFLHKDSWQKEKNRPD